MQIILPDQIKWVIDHLKEAGFEAFVVGGCTRDSLMGREPKDWDVTTSALPEQIQKTFPESFYNNVFGTVGVHADGGVVEVTTYRSEGAYTDKRHPDKVKFGVTLEEDLERRDFTINALAYDGQEIKDLFNGQEDLKNKFIKAVGNPEERFNEDALRILRAIRFASQLGFTIEENTWQAIIKNKQGLLEVSGERIRDEIMKIINSNNLFKGFWLLDQAGILELIIPEFKKTIGLAQNKHHIYTVFFHCLLSAQYCPSEDPLVKLATLFHDIGKPQTKEGEGVDASFHQHEYVSAKITGKIMKRLKFSKKDTDRVTHLVRQHMFYYNIGEITDAGVRRMAKRIGLEHLQDLIDLRVGDRMGSGCLKEKPFKLVELERRIAKVSQDPITTSMLKVDGNRVMELLDLKPGREVGLYLNALLEEILEDPSLNTVEYLEKRVKEIKP